LIRSLQRGGRASTLGRAIGELGRIPKTLHLQKSPHRRSREKVEERATMVQSNAPAEIYQLHILLLQINPPIWRRLHVRSDSSIATLHELLQIAFDWSDFHLHRFVIRGKEYGSS